MGVVLVCEVWGFGVGVSEVGSEEVVLPLIWNQGMWRPQRLAVVAGKVILSRLSGS